MILKHLKQTSSASFDMNPHPGESCTYKPRITKCTWSVWGREHNLAKTRKLVCVLRRYLLLWSLLFGQSSDNSRNVGSMWIIKLVLLQQVAISDRSNPNNQTHFVKRIIHHNGPIRILSTVIYP